MLCLALIAASLNPVGLSLCALAEPLPLIKLPAKNSPSDDRATQLLSAISIGPLVKGIYPNYRDHSYEESNRAVDAWTKADFDSIEKLQKFSEEFRQLLIPEKMALDPKIGGVNINGMLCGLAERANYTQPITENFFVQADDAPALISVLPTKAVEMKKDLAGLRGSQVRLYKTAVLEKDFGIAETKSFIDLFRKLQQIPGRPRQVWQFCLSSECWLSKLYKLKKELATCGYDAYAGEITHQQKFFAKKPDAANYLQLLATSDIASTTIDEEKLAIVVLNQQCDVISTAGAVHKRSLDSAAQKRFDENDRQLQFWTQVAKWFGLEKYGFLNNRIMVGRRFQFDGYPENWLPPCCAIEYLPNQHVRITSPGRYVVKKKYMQAFALPHFDQYKYLLAQGVTGINQGLGSRDIRRRLSLLDAKYGLVVINANYDSVTALLDKSPANLQQFRDEMNGFGLNFSAQQIDSFAKQRKIDLYWD